MKNHDKQTVVVILGIFCLLAGLLGLILPILPGVLLIILGLMLLAVYNPKIDAWVNQLTVKHPPSYAAAQNIKKFIERIIGKI